MPYIKKLIDNGRLSLIMVLFGPISGDNDGVPVEDDALMKRKPRMARMNTRSQVLQKYEQPKLLLWILAFSAATIVTLSLMAQPAMARGTPETFADVVENVMPAVVNISTIQLVETQRGSRNMPQLPRGGPWDEMFKDFLEQFGDQLPQQDDGDSDGPKRRARSLGSGFIISSDAETW